MPLPTPKKRQREILSVGHQGHFAVLGTAGSGKTTLAILRSAYLADTSVSHGGRTLLLTFNKALVTYLRHLASAELSNVHVENYHTFARGYLNARGKMGRYSICDKSEREQLISAACAESRKIHPQDANFQRHDQFFYDEIEWIAGNGIATEAAYLTAARVGQRTPLGINARKAVWMIRNQYHEARSQRGRLYDWDDIATAVRNQLSMDTSARRYRHIVIDEGQDFSPEMIRSIALAADVTGSITFFGDVAQQIYGSHGVSWRTAGLDVQKVILFEENYRNTKQIAKLALAVSTMPYYAGTVDLIEPREPKADGPLPTVVRFKDAGAERDFIHRRIRADATGGSVAVLFKNWEDQRRTLPASVTRTGVRLDKDMKVWVDGPGLRYGTFHGAKGLEFDTVILPLGGKDNFPDPEYVAAHGAADAASYYGRLLYVGITRARLNLIITCTGEMTELLPPATGLYTVVDL